MYRKQMRWLLSISLLGMFLSSCAVASVWCGQNGLIRLSFTEGDSLVGVLATEPDSSGLTAVDLYAVLDDVELVARDGEKFVSLGGFEFKLAIEGAEGIIQAQEFPFRQFNMGQQLGTCYVGIYPGLAITAGRATLVHWRILFRGKPQNVVFRLDPTGLRSCATLAGCEQHHPYALYTGTPTAGQTGDMFGAGYVPAYLNFDGEADLSPVTGSGAWHEVGVYRRK